MADPVFNDPALRKALAETRGAFEWRLRLLDNVSADIKTVESYLNESGVRVEAEVLCGVREVIRWARGEPDRWRLIYQEEGQSPRILIETKADVRLAAKAALPMLVRELAAAIERAMSE